jgi:membrane-bound metal-dependent hydrolase YbcI (DUF457 family)
MLGKHHAVFGAASFVAVAAVGQMGLRPEQVVVGAAVAMGAALVPDLDEPGASASRSFGRIGRCLSHLIARLSGGHRGATHTIPAVAAVGVSTAGALQNHTAAAVLLGLLVVVGLDVLPQVREGTEWIVGALVAVGAQQVVVTGDVWPVVAVVVGMLSHMVGDTLTPYGVPWCWPLRDLDETTSWGVFRSGSWAEPVVTWSLVGGLLLAAQGA